jgi:adenosylcobinamide-GDP ribazoletransferase
MRREYRIKENKYLSFLAALQFLTILPIKRGFTPEQLGRSVAFFPAVGTILGLGLAGLNWLLGLILPYALVDIILVAALAIFSGFLHLDGLADTLDGIAGHRTVERRLEIMRDSRIGGFGAAGLALFLLAEYVALSSIPQHWVPYALILAPALGRWSMAVSIFCYPYARPSGLGTSFKKAASRTGVVAATLLALIVAAGLFRLGGLVIMAAAWLVFTLVALYVKSKLNGLTGDSYGAINELTTLTIFILVSMLSFKGWLI